VTDEEWEKQRTRAVMAAFQTGRPVFADTEGELRYTDGSHERVPANVGTEASVSVARGTGGLPRAARASRRAYVASIVAAIGNAIGALWHPWQIAVAATFVASALIWRHVHRGQRALLRGAV
jgi:hypothetical protein